MAESTRQVRSGDPFERFDEAIDDPGLHDTYPFQRMEARDADPLERFPAKWKPVRVKKTRQIKNPEPRFGSIETEKAPGDDNRVGR